MSSNMLVLQDRSKLYMYLTSRFSLAELKNLAMDLGIDANLLPHNNRADFARELIAYIESREQITGLISTAVDYRPDAEIAQLLQPPPASFDFREQPIPMPAFVSSEVEAAQSQATTNPLQRNQVFISYNHRDKKAFERLQTILKLRPSIKEGTLVIWDDTVIKPGDNWREQMVQALAASKVVVLLISADFLASDFINPNELPPLLKAAEKKEVVMLLVYVEPCSLQGTPLANFQSVNKPSDYLSRLDKYQQDEVWVKVAEFIAELVA